MKPTTSDNHAGPQDFPEDLMEFSQIESLEHQEIEAQRSLRNVLDDYDAPHTGLALSGGGIRSATFALGVLQTLGRLTLPVKGRAVAKPLMDFIDYLSTVSGGGYIGTWLVANRKRERNERGQSGTEFACADKSCDKATEQVAHLRRYSHYLNPEASMMSADTWTMVAIWFRNTLLIQSMVFCVIASFMMLPHLWLRLISEMNLLLGTAAASLSYRWVELLFPLSIFGCFLVAYRHAKKEVLLFFKDQKVDSGKVQASSIKPIDQGRVQKYIVVPAVAAALLTTIWFWSHHERLHVQIRPADAFKQAKELLGSVGIMNNVMNRIQASLADATALADATSVDWSGWWRGLETRTMLASPWMWLLTFGVVLLASRLMWLKEDNAAIEKRGWRFWPKFWQHVGDHIACWLSTEVPPPAKPGPLKLAWKPWLLQMREEGHRRLGFFIALACGSLFSLYLIDEAFRWLRDLQVSFSAPAPAMTIDMSMPRGELHAAYTAAEGSKKSFEIGIGLVACAGPTLMVLKYMFILILALGLASRRMAENVREWWSRVAAWLMIYSLVVLMLCGISLFGPVVFDWIGDRMSVWMQGGVISGWLATLVATLMRGSSEKTSGHNDKKTPVLNLDSAALVIFAGLLAGAAWMVRFMLTPEGFSPQAHDPLLLQTIGDHYHGWVRFWGMWGVLGLASAVLVWRIDLNEFSMNHFYRNRLVRCYLGGATHLKDNRRPHPFTGFEFRDDQPLAEFTEQHGHPGPYPLINTALNTSQGGDLDVQERKAESFLLSPLFCGSSRRRLTIPEREMQLPKQGFRSTGLYMSGRGDREACQVPAEQRKGITIGTAMSISGAAASPNSGYHTSPVLAFLMTVFNARLGWWVPNPAKPDASIWQSQRPAFPGFLKYLTFELFGSATPDSEFIYLSDGGHFENLGIYELVRRKCRFIIAIDGEEDGDYTFHALGTAIRRCRVDFDAEIEINVDAIRPDPATGRSRGHCAVGKIHYAGESEVGTLLYIKSSLTGDESTDIAQYKQAAPAFPHESTGDQFFSESQFESYRKLGMHAAEEALFPLVRKSMPEAEPADPTQQLRSELKEHWYRGSNSAKEAFTGHAQALDDIWKSLMEDGVPDCIREIVLPRKAGVAVHGMPADAAEQLRVMCFGQRLIQLMENVCLDLELSASSSNPDHSGWVYLFRCWANHPVLRLVWKESKETYGKRFGHFWEDLQGS